MAVFFVAPAIASAAPGDLDYKGCVSSNSNQASCSQLLITNAGGGGTALDGVTDAVESPDGAHLYVISANSDTISWLTRSASTGALTFSGCLTGDTSIVGCQTIATATTDGTSSGMQVPGAVAITPDGRDVFVAAQSDDSLVRFTRNAATGALTFERCISSNSDPNNTCMPMPVEAASGTNTALDGAADVVVSPDSANVYVAAPFSDAISRFGRNPTTGTFTGFQDCLTGDTNVSNTGSCAQLGGAAASGTGHRLNTLGALAASPDGKTIVGAAAGASAVTDFARGPGGVLNVGSCISSKTTTAGCSGTFANTNDGVGRALFNANSVAISPNNENVYVGAGSSDAVSVIGRNTTTGAIEGFEGCRTSATNTVGCTVDPGSGATSHLKGVASVAVSPDNSSVYAGSSIGDALTINERRAANGAFFFARCISSNSNLAHCGQVSPSAANGVNTPLGDTQAVVPSADGKDVYVVAVSDVISQFEIEGTRPPVTPPGEQPPGGQPPGGAAPANDITIGRAAKNKKKGTAKLTVSVPGPGEVALDGNGVAARSATAAGAGDLTLKLKTDGNKRKKLSRKGQIKVTPEVTFTPIGGAANTESTQVKLIDR